VPKRDGCRARGVCVDWGTRGPLSDGSVPGESPASRRPPDYPTSARRGQAEQGTRFSFRPSQMAPRWQVIKTDATLRTLRQERPDQGLLPSMLVSTAGRSNCRLPRRGERPRRPRSSKASSAGAVPRPRDGSECDLHHCPRLAAAVRLLPPARLVSSRAETAPGADEHAGRRLGAGDVDEGKSGNVVKNSVLGETQQACARVVSQSSVKAGTEVSSGVSLAEPPLTPRPAGCKVPYAVLRIEAQLLSVPLSHREPCRDLPWLNVFCRRRELRVSHLPYHPLRRNLEH